MGLIRAIIKQIIKARGGESPRVQIGINWVQMGGGGGARSPPRDALLQQHGFNYCAHTPERDAPLPPKSSPPKEHSPRICGRKTGTPLPLGRPTIPLPRFHQAALASLQEGGKGGQGCLPLCGDSQGPPGTPSLGQLPQPLWRTPTKARGCCRRSLRTPPPTSSRGP